MKLHKKTALFKGMVSASAFLLSVSVLASNVLEANGMMVDATFNTKREITITTDDGTLFDAFKPTDILDKDGMIDPAKATEISDAYNIAVGQEGTVLFKNTNNVLPAKSAKKITILGSQYNKVNSIATAFANKGVEVNPTAVAAYSSNKGSNPNPGYANNKCWGKNDDNEYYESQSVTKDGKTFVTLKIHEPTMEELTKSQPTLVDSFKEYNDLGIVVLYRGSAEGADFKAGEDGMHPEGDTGARTSLALVDNERAIIKAAKDNFDKVVVIVACSNTMEIKEIAEDEGVDSLIYVPTTVNAKNTEGLVDNILGNSSFSGGSNHFWASNTLSAPAMMNQGFFRYSNAKDIKIYKNKAAMEAAGVAYGTGAGRIDTSTIGTNGTDVGYTNYLIEAEGIYVGYRYYESRYYDTVMGQNNAKSKTGAYDSTGDWNYAEETAFGFGYGLSYTTFDRTITNVKFINEGVHAKNHERYAEVTVEVKNTGDFAAKTPVQIYGQAPYTEYDKKNGVEKSAIQLLEFGKTGVIQPGKSETVTVKVDLADLASFDGNKARTYIMDNIGDYYFATGNGAHDALNNILAAQGKTTANGMDYNGDSKAAYKWNYESAVAGDVDNFTFAISKSGAKIEAQLDSSQWGYYGDKDTVTNLTRADWTGTYPKAYTNLTANANMLKYLNGMYCGNVKSSAEELKEIKWEQPTELKFADMKGAKYDDYRWQELLDSINLDEAIYYCYKSGRQFGALSFGFPAGNYAENGANKTLAWATGEGAINPPWLPEGAKASYASVTLASPQPMACTFNHDIAKMYGKLMGLGGIMGEKPFLWAPGANTFRTQYNGRSSLYYSEDPILTGVNVMECAVEALNYGGYATAKHFAFNDQELGRSGIAPFMTEQRAREIELHAFQYGIESNAYDTAEKDTGCKAIMTAFNKLGAIEMTCNSAVLKNILRDEWGYNGYVVSDLKDDIDLATQCFQSGMTGFDIRADGDDVTPYLDNAAFREDANLQKNMKEMIHREMWMFANSSLMNKVNTSSYSVWNMTWWRAAYIGAIAATAALTAITGILFLASLPGGKKKKEGK